jgi:hypothetical protein
MNTAACVAVAARNITNRGSAVVTHKPRQRRGHDELLANHPDEEPDNRLRQPPDADHPARERVLDDPGQASREHPGGRTARERYVHNDDQYQVQRRRAADKKTRQGRLQRERQSYGDQDPGCSHLRS